MPPTLLEIIQRTALYFEKAGLETPRLDSEWLIAGVLGCKRLDLFLQFDRPLEDAVLDELRPLVRRRAKREPLQHIIGTVDFAGLSLQADRRALVPRPETEYLIELLLEMFIKPPGRVLDLGTGSGAIALALAKQWPEAAVVGVDRSVDALELAHENMERCSVRNVQFCEGSWFEGVDEGDFDLIVSNPPYLSEDEWETALPEVRDYDPKAALVAADEGLADLDHILNAAQGYMRPGALLALETGIAHHRGLECLAKDKGYTAVESRSDNSGRVRFFFCRKEL